MSAFFKNIPSILFLSCILANAFPVVTSSDNYVIEARVFVDEAGIKKFEKLTKKNDTGLRTEVTSLFVEISHLMGSLKRYNLNLDIRIKELVLLKKNILPADRNGKINSDKATSTFKNWIRRSDNSKYHDYDVAILFTGYDFGGNNYGYAYIGTVCSPNGVGVVELSGSYGDALGAAHEIGHILGAEHDGSKKAPSCSGTSGYIMNPKSKPPSINHFSYSSCSARFFKTKFDQLTRYKENCLTNGNSPSASTGKRFGSLVSPDEVCKRAYGSTTYVARMAYSSYGDNVCVELACMEGMKNNMYMWSYTLTPQGMPCGKSKICNQGKCVHSAGADPHIKNTCPFGDQPKIEGPYETTCSEMAPLHCASWKKACCQSCNIHNPGKGKTADEICRSLAGAGSSLARKRYHSYGDQLCSHLACTTKTVGRMFYWRTYKAPDGMACGKRKRCKNGKCVLKKKGNENMSDSCPYGDQPWLGGEYKTTCAKITSQMGCSGWETACCASCPKH